MYLFSLLVYSNFSIFIILNLMVLLLSGCCFCCWWLVDGALPLLLLSDADVMAKQFIFNSWRKKKHEQIKIKFLFLIFVIFFIFIFGFWFYFYTKSLLLHNLVFILLYYLLLPVWLLALTASRTQFIICWGRSLSIFRIFLESKFILFSLSVRFRYRCYFYNLRRISYYQLGKVVWFGTVSFDLNQLFTCNWFLINLSLWRGSFFFLLMSLKLLIICIPIVF